MSVCFTQSETILYYVAETTTYSPFKQSFSPYVKTSTVSELKKVKFPQKWCRRRSKCLLTEIDPSLDTLRKRRKCAIVGNSGILLDSKCGRAIDSHDFVVRANLAELDGYIPDVGKKCNLMMINMETMLKIDTILNEYNVDQRSLKQLLDHLRSLNCTFIWYPKGTGKNGHDRILARIARRLNESNINSKIAFSMPGTGDAAER